MIAKKVFETLNFERGSDPKKSMNIGNSFRIQEFIDFIEKELSWTLSQIYNEEGGLYLECPAQTSIVKEIKEAINKFGWTDRMKVKIIDNQYRSGNHIYAIVPREKNKLKESLNFERGENPHRNLRVGKYKATPITFEDDGEKYTIEVIDNSFRLSDMEVRLEFKEMPDIGESADVYVDDQKNDYMVFKMEPFDYEFESQGKHSNPGYTDYGFPVAKDEKHLKELKEKYSYWTAMGGDYSRENKSPFVAVAKLILFTY